MSGLNIILAKEFECELWVKASDLEKRIKRAVEAEREACAKVCDKKMERHGWCAYIDDIADEIRARGNDAA